MRHRRNRGRAAGRARQSKEEAGTAARLAFHTDVAAVGADDVLDDGQAEPGAGILSRTPRSTVQAAHHKKA
jgi:hypothetical protein